MRTINIIEGIIISTCIISYVTFMSITNSINDINLDVTIDDHITNNNDKNNNDNQENNDNISDNISDNCGQIIELNNDDTEWNVIEYHDAVD